MITPIARPTSPWWRRWSHLRRLVQVLALGIFVWLIARQPTSSGWSFALDPLVAVAALVAGTIGLGLALGAVVMLGLSVVLGRFACGWLCPLGTLLDLQRRLSGWLLRPLHRITNDHRRPGVQRLARLRWGVLAAVVVGTLVGLPLLGLLEPLSLLTRVLATSVLPAISPETATPTGPGQMTPDLYHFIGAPVKHVLVSVWGGAGPALGLLVFIAALELVQPRFWCRNLCPSGALFGLVARWSLVRRLPQRTCGSCRVCADTCTIGAFAPDGRLDPAACTACLACLADCPPQIAVLGRRIPGSPATLPDPGRRRFLGAVALGAATPVVAAIATRSVGLEPVAADPFRLRPPRAATSGAAGKSGDAAFLSACIRCGACVQACPTHALQLTDLRDGLSGLLAPRLVPRTGACDHACQACATACPTGAIPLTALAEKFHPPIGTAIHDHDRCLPWGTGGECRVCAEHCPATDAHGRKAIRLHLGRAADGGAVMLPQVDADTCVGCGTCEFVCPVEGDAGIRVVDSAQTPTLRRVMEHRSG